MRHYDFKYHTKYEKVTDYVKGKKNKVKGDKYMYSVKNNSNGDLVVSTRPINKNSFINTLNYYSGRAIHKKREKLYLLSINKINHLLNPTS